ncbi:MAG: methyltransferase domain-containing protein [Acidimicrobiales bacterium]|nr:methyltransferase domain-containing protein [Acidimicrobiales bacterium]
MEGQYTHGHHDSVLRSHRWRTVENSAGYLLEHLRPGASLLDVGCGPGTITVDLARRLASGTVVGIDPSADVIAAATAGAADAGVGNLELRVGDVYALDVPDASFDVVHAHQVLQHVSDPVGALRAMRRVVRPGGVVAARDSIYRAMAWYPREPGLDRWLQIYCAVAEANGGEPDAGSRLLSWAQAAGFEDVRCTASAWCYASPEERVWWSDLWADRTEQTALSDRAVELGLATRDDLAEMADAWRRWAGHAGGWFAVPCGEIVARR